MIDLDIDNISKFIFSTSKQYHGTFILNFSLCFLCCFGFDRSVIILIKASWSLWFTDIEKFI